MALQVRASVATEEGVSELLVSLCRRERDGAHKGLGGVFEVFMEGVGHRNIVCYPKEHIILDSEKMCWLYSNVITVSL